MKLNKTHPMLGPLLFLTVALTTPVVRAVDKAPDGDTNSVEAITLHKSFHIAGVPGMRRNDRADVVLSTQTLRIRKGDREPLIVPYRRITHFRITPGERDYAKTTYAAVLVVGAPGALLLMKKRKVDSLALEFENEHGGSMFVVMQVPKSDGVRVKEWVQRFGVQVEEGPQSAWLGK